MPLNSEGLNNPFDIDTLSIHSSNPGTDATPAAATELTDAPYARKAVTLSAPTGGVVTVQADVVFDISTASNQNCAFIGLWKAGVYKGYSVPSIPRNFTEVATSRTFTVASGSTLSITNAV